jgi:hypothetical protein
MSANTVRDRRVLVRLKIAQQPDRHRADMMPLKKDAKVSFERETPSPSATGE